MGEPALWLYSAAVDMQPGSILLFLCVTQEDDVKQLFNDSGCLLVDKDLFETGLEEENNSPLEDEESLESIREAVKNKVKKHKASKR